MLGMMETSNAHLAEGKLLQHLLQEAAVNDNGSLEETDHEREISTDQQLQKMIENYQQSVLKQKQHYQVNGYNAHSSGQDHLKPNGSSIDGPARIRISKANGGSAPPSTMSHSQPCLYVNEQKYESNGNSYMHYPNTSDPREQNPEQSNSNSVDINAVRAENIFLKQQVELLQKNTKILRNLELSYERIERDFSQTTLHREKQEQLEQAIRFKMEQQLQRLTNENELLQRQVEKLNLLVVQQPVDPDHLVHYNRLMTDVLPQNKELLAIKERQQIEIEAQNATLEEQRNHIEMLDKALSNAQERLANKERSAIDAAALVDKCSHQQKLLQEALDEKQKLQEENGRHKAQLEKEISQLKTQLEHAGLHKNNWSTDQEEMAKLRKTLQTKDNRIVQLESNLFDLQKKNNEEIQRNEATTRTETEALLTKIRNLEKEKSDRDGKIQNLVEDKQRIHNQWANDRHSLDHQIRMLEQNLRHSNHKIKILEQNVKQNDHYQFNGFKSGGFYSSQQSPTSPSSEVPFRSFPSNTRNYNEPTSQQLKELTQKIADRRATPPNSSTTWMNRMTRPSPQFSSHNRSASGSALTDYTNTTITTHHPTNTAIVSLVNPVGHHSSASSADSTTNSSESISPSTPLNLTTSVPSHSSTTTINTSTNVQFSLPARSPNSTASERANRMASKMPTSNLSSYIENLPSTNRIMKKKTRSVMGSDFRRSAWTSSSNETPTSSLSPQQRNSISTDLATNNVSNTSSDGGDGHLQLTTVVEVNNLSGNRDDKYPKHQLQPAKERHFNMSKEDDK